MKMFVGSPIKLALGLLSSVFVLAACTLDDPGKSGTYSVGQMTQARATQASLQINEGETRLVSFEIDPSIQETIYVSWTIFGGFSRFLKASGVESLAPGVSEFSIELSARSNDVLDPDETFTLRLESSSFEETVDVEILVVDPTEPAQLTLVPDSDLQFNTVIVNETSHRQFTVKNTGGYRASGLQVIGLVPPFGFRGNGYPGTGGTCTALLEAGDSCVVALEFSPTASGSFAKTIQVRFESGEEQQSTPITLKGNADDVVAIMSNLPGDPSNVVTFDIDVSGTDVVEYKYKWGGFTTTDCSDSSGYSGAISVVTPISDDISGVADGRYMLCVVGKNSLNLWQAYDSASVHQWLKDTVPPVSPSMVINEDATYTTAVDVTLSLSAGGAEYVYVTNQSGCSAGGIWNLYQTAKSWTLPSSNAPMTVYSRFRDRAGNVTGCVSDSIIHDDIRPSVTVNQAATQGDPALTLPLAFEVTFSEDINPSTFTVDDIIQNGSATGLVWNITAVSGSEYLIELTQVGQGGSITPSISEGLVADLAGNTNTASTSTDNTITYNSGEFYFSQLESGGKTTCGLTNKASVFCWGDDSDGQVGNGAAGATTKPSAVDVSGVAGSQEFIRVWVGARTSCGLQSDLKGYCWGRGLEGQIGNNQKQSVDKPTPITYAGVFKELAPGDDHTCGVNYSGQALCWGQADRGQIGDSQNLAGAPVERITPTLVSTGHIAGFAGFTSIVSGQYFSCGLSKDHIAYCWGESSNGRLGSGDTTDQSRPVEVDLTALASAKLIQLAAGESHICGLDVDGKAYCWGRGFEGQLGNGFNNDEPIPVAVDTSLINGFEGFEKLTAGSHHTCGVTKSKRLLCWGKGGTFQLGQGLAQSSNIPTLVRNGDGGAVLTSVFGVASGSEHTCLLNGNGEAHCIGANDAGQIGDGGGPSRSMPTPASTSDLVGARSMISLAAGIDHSCALDSRHAVTCWGKGASGQLGSGALLDRYAPGTVSFSASGATGPFVQVVSGREHSCALTRDHKVYCWGSGAQGRLGTGSVNSQLEPTAVDVSGLSGFKGFVNITAGGYHTCGVELGGDAYCWGWNFYGQLGNGTTTDALTPVKVDTSLIVGTQKFSSIGAGDLHTCGIVNDGQVHCWGYGANGRLGYGNIDTKTLPTLVDFTAYTGYTGSVSVSLGKEHTCVLGVDREIYCWGTGASGRLGDGFTFDRLKPVKVDRSFISGFTGFRDLSVGFEHSCSVTNQGRAYCWGSGEKGRLGDGTTVFKVRPAEIDGSGHSDLGRILTISAGGTHSCAVGLNGKSYCWGEGLNGRLGNFNIINWTSPVQVNFP